MEQITIVTKAIEKFASKNKYFYRSASLYYKNMIKEIKLGKTVRWIRCFVLRRSSPLAAYLFTSIPVRP